MANGQSSIPRVSTPGTDSRGVQPTAMSFDIVETAAGVSFLVVVVVVVVYG